MNINIDAKDIILKDLFSPKFVFNVPGYQRPFSWDSDNLNQLFDDLNEARRNNENSYFLGSIILQAKSLEHDGSGIYDVVDGQQRLTTLVILFAVMRDLSDSKDAISVLQNKIYQEANEYENRSEDVRLRVRDKDKVFFRKYILEPEGTKQLVNDFCLSDSQLKMKMAVDTFNNKLKMADGTVDQLLLDSMIKYILNNTVMVYVKTMNISSAFRLFSVLNARGMDLTASDLLKSENLSTIDETHRAEFQNIWETIEDELGREELDKLIGFIRTIFVKEKAKKSIYEEYNEIIFKKNPMFKGKNFINYLGETADIYREKVLNAELSNEKDNVQFHNLMSLMRSYLKFSDWIPVFIFFYKKFQSDNKLLLFLQKLESKIVLNWIRELSPTERIVDMNKVISLIEQSQTVDEVLNNKLFDTTNLDSEIERIFKNSYFYMKNYCTYILLRLDLSLSENSNIERSYKNTISVEHILPQNPSSNSTWNNDFSLDERFTWTNSIGNLVLLSRKKNSSANNRPFDKKKESYYKNGITDFELTKEILDYDVWDVTSIATRQELCIKRAKLIWLNINT